MTEDIHSKYLEKAIDEHAIVSATDAAGNITYVNQKFTEISGYTRAELLGNNHRLLKSGVHPDAFYRKIWDTLLSGETWHGEVCNRRKNGEYYWVRASILPILDEDGLPVQYISIRTDISEIKLAEARLHEANVSLEAYRQASEYELGIARELMERMIRESSAPVSDIEIWMQATTNLNGDLVITQNYFNERSYILVADAMGHGLTAALSLVPVVQSFSTMAHNGFSVSAIAREMNRKVADFIPVGNFVAASLVCVDHGNQLIEIWNGGNPPALLLNEAREVARKFPSRHLALGILRNGGFDSTTEVLHWPGACCLTLYSDGLMDAQNTQGEVFGEDRIIAALRAKRPHQSLKDAVLAHVADRDIGDDISIATISLARAP